MKLYHVLRRRGTTDKQYIDLLQSHLDRLYEENFNLKNNIKDLSSKEKIVPIEMYNDLQHDYQNLVLKLKSYGLWIGE